jgi:ribosomal protein L34E
MSTEELRARESHRRKIVLQGRKIVLQGLLGVGAVPLCQQAAADVKKVCMSQRPQPCTGVRGQGSRPQREMGGMRAAFQIMYWGVRKNTNTEVQN